MPTPFDVLGLEPTFDLDLAMLDKRFRELSRAAHPDRAGTAHLGRAMDLNAAYRVLRDDIGRAGAVLEARGVSPQDDGTAVEPEFLGEMLEWREALGDARAARDRAALADLEARVRARYEDERRTLASRLETRRDAEARASLGRMRYLRRLLDACEARDETSETS